VYNCPHQGSIAQLVRAPLCRSGGYDATGRVLISPELRSAAGIQKDTMLLGMGNHFELWDRASYDAQETQALQGDMPDVFKDFSF